MLPQAKQTIHNTSTVLYSQPDATTISPFIKKCPGGHKGPKGNVNRSRLHHEVEDKGPVIVILEGVRTHRRGEGGRKRPGERPQDRRGWHQDRIPPHSYYTCTYTYT